MPFIANPNDKPYALVDQNNKVTIVIVYDNEVPYTPNQGLTLIGPLADGETVKEGYTYHEDTDTFMPPDPME